MWNSLLIFGLMSKDIREFVSMKSYPEETKDLVVSEKGPESNFPGLRSTMYEYIIVW